ncbi:hypothetical protein K9B32_00980 [Rhizobium sp. 3T7]|uniref:hypothetical protein n=1 Tax=Rhizobium sp. 3T7 TaxID=2874922 RepID=UPI001CCE37A3|nr:hypothetical protein [Rhizobium sp. 3T7]MBZ9788710.1 hypothetical protein [Rhizobium sp. 3T7]
MGGINVNVTTNGSSGNKAKDEEYSQNMGKFIGAAADQHMSGWSSRVRYVADINQKKLAKRAMGKVK